MATGTKTTNLSLANLTAALLAYTSRPRYVGWGIGTTTPAVTSVDLSSPGAHEARTTGTDTAVQTVAVGDTYQIVAQITCLTAGKAITEVGWWDTDDATPWTGPAGNLCGLSVFAAINVAVSDSITFTIKIAYSDNST
jgi:hypothetical protein